MKKRTSIKITQLNELQQEVLKLFKIKKTGLEKTCSNKIEKISAYVAEYLCVVKVKSVKKQK